MAVQGAVTEAWGQPNNWRGLVAPVGADRSLAVSDEGGGCEIGYRWARQVHCLALLLSYL